jgi:hypothetical protein
MTKRRTKFDSHEWTRFASTEWASGKFQRDFLSVNASSDSSQDRDTFLPIHVI